MNFPRSRLLFVALPIVLLAPVGSSIDYPIALLALIAGAGIFLLIQEERQTTEIPAVGSTILIAVYLCTTTLICAWITQPQDSINDGMGLDGIFYAHLYEYFATGQSDLPIAKPYHQRLGVPFLAAQLPFAPAAGFHFIHSVFWLGTMSIFVLIVRQALRLPESLTMLGLVWLQVHWIGIPRGAAFNAFTVDSAALFFMVALTYCYITRRHALWFMALAAVGAFFKETILLWCICLAIGTVAAGDRSERKALIFALVPSIALAKGVSVFCDSVVLGTSTDGSLTTLLGWFRIRGFELREYLRYLAAMFNALGGFMILFLASLPTWLGNRSTCKEANHLILALAVYLGVCFFAGSDLTRFAFMSFPLAIPATLLLVEKQLGPEGRRLAFLVVIATLPAAHPFELITSPAPGHEWPNQNVGPPYSWTMEYSHFFLVTAWLGYLIVLLLATYFPYRRIQGNRR